MMQHWVLLIVFCSFQSVFAADFFGELQLDAKVQVKPSSELGHSAFELGHLYFGGKHSLWEQGYLKAHLQVLNTLKAKELRLVAQSIFLANDELNYGVISHPWMDLMNQFWKNNDLSTYSSSLIGLYKYTPLSDIGMTYSFGESVRTTWMISNGEEAAAGEESTRKDAYLHVQIPMGQGQVAFGYIYGGYDGVDAVLSKKERVLFMLGFRNELWSTALEGFRGFDPVDKINGIVADQVDLTLLGGTRVTSEGASALIKWKPAESARWEAQVYGTWLNPVKESTSQWVRTQFYGIQYRANEKVVITFFNEQSQYGESHRLNARDTEKYKIATQVLF